MERRTGAVVGEDWRGAVSRDEEDRGSLQVARRNGAVVCEDQRGAVSRELSRDGTDAGWIF